MAPIDNKRVNKDWYNYSLPKAKNFEVKPTVGRPSFWGRKGVILLSLLPKSSFTNLKQISCYHVYQISYTNQIKSLGLLP